MKIDAGYTAYSNITLPNKAIEEAQEPAVSRFDTNDVIELSEDLLQTPVPSEGSSGSGGAPHVPPIKDKPDKGN